MAAEKLTVSSSATDESDSDILLPGVQFMCEPESSPISLPQLTEDPDIDADQVAVQAHHFKLQLILRQQQFHDAEETPEQKEPQHQKPKHHNDHMLIDENAIEFDFDIEMPPPKLKPIEDMLLTSQEIKQLRNDLYAGPYGTLDHFCDEYAFVRKMKILLNGVKFSMLKHGDESKATDVFLLVRQDRLYWREDRSKSPFFSENLKKQSFLLRDIERVVIGSNRAVFKHDALHGIDAKCWFTLHTMKQETLDLWTQTNDPTMVREFAVFLKGHWRHYHNQHKEQVDDEE